MPEESTGSGRRSRKLPAGPQLNWKIHIHKHHSPSFSTNSNHSRNNFHTFVHYQCVNLTNHAYTPVHQPNSPLPLPPTAFPRVSSGRLRFGINRGQNNVVLGSEADLGSVSEDVTASAGIEGLGRIDCENCTQETAVFVVWN